MFDLLARLTADLLCQKDESSAEGDERRRLRERVHHQGPDLGLCLRGIDQGCRAGADRREKEHQPGQRQHGFHGVPCVEQEQFQATRSLLWYFRPSKRFGARGWRSRRRLLSRVATNAVLFTQGRIGQSGQNTPATSAAADRRSGRHARDRNPHRAVRRVSYRVRLRIGAASGTVLQHCPPSIERARSQPLVPTPRRREKHRR